MSGADVPDRGRVRFSPFAFDPATGELRKDGRPVKLHPQPAKVLALLVSRPGEIVTRKEIQKAVWSDDTHVDFDLGLNSCVRQIRAALGDNVETPRFVETLPKVGYRFVAKTASDAEPVRARALTRRKGFWRAALGVVGTAVAVAVLLALMLRSFRRGDAELPSDESAITVLPFDNLSADASLEWLRVGLADMLITDLSRLSTVDVVSTDRLLRILDDAGYADEAVTSEPVVRDVARQAGTGRVVLGSFMKAGESIRINVRVQHVRTGEILATTKVEGFGGAGIFSMVDDLSEALRASLALPSGSGHSTLTFADYSTSSIEAYRYLVEGGLLLRRGKSAEALQLYLKAADEDPEWAKPVTMVGMMYANTGREKQAEDHARRALELSRRLVPKERYSIEGFFYALREETYWQAIEKYRQHIELVGQISSHHMVARRLFLLERVDEAIGHWEILTDAKHSGWFAYDQLAGAYAHQERFDEAYDLLATFIDRFPDRAEAHAGLGNHWVRAGRLDLADDAFETAERLEPARRLTPFGRFEAAVLRHDWSAAEGAMERMRSLRNPASKGSALRRLALVALYRGQAELALEYLDEAASLYEHPRTRSAAASNQGARVLLALEEYDRALESSRNAQRHGEGNYPEWQGIFYEGSALAGMGRFDSAEERAAKLEARTRSMHTEKETRRRHHLLGEIALARGDPQKALAELETARSMLLARGFTVGAKDPPPHVPIWFSLAMAHRAKGDPDEATRWFQQIVDSTTERIWWPIEYVRSFYYLGEAYEQRGDVKGGGEHYRRFYQLWRDGELDRELIAEARAKME